MTVMKITAVMSTVMTRVAIISTRMTATATTMPMINAMVITMMMKPTWNVGHIDDVNNYHNDGSRPWLPRLSADAVYTEEVTQEVTVQIDTSDSTAGVSNTLPADDRAFLP